MDYTPRYSQPFTLREAVALDVPVITEEISRLQNSLSKLHDTQEQLGEYIQQCNKNGQVSDADVVLALEENRGVIGSQEERISILKMALAEKGVDTSGGHYDAPRPKSTPDSTTDEVQPVQPDTDGGVYL